MRQSSQALGAEQNQSTTKQPTYSTTFTSGYGHFLHDSWSNYNYAPKSMLHADDGLYGLSNHLSVLQCNGSLSYLIQQLTQSLNHSEEEAHHIHCPTKLAALENLLEQQETFSKLSTQIDMMQQVSDSFNQTPTFAHPSDMHDEDEVQDLPPAPIEWHDHIKK